MSRTSSKMMNYPAADRNKEPILNVLRRYVPSHFQQTSPASAQSAEQGADTYHVLEVCSGTGQHVKHFSQNFSPSITWQPSEVDFNSMESIRAYISGHELHNVRSPTMTDVSLPWQQWGGGVQPGGYDLILCVNLTHISPYDSTLGLMKGAGVILKPGAVLLIYGPFCVNGVMAPASNVRFDAGLRTRNPQYGLRDTRDLEKVGLENNLALEMIHDMPANNHTLVFRKAGH